MNKEILEKKLKTMQVIEKELCQRIKLGKNKTINVGIAVANRSWESMDTIAKSYVQDFQELNRMVETLSKLTKDMENLIGGIDNV